jgi:hypothetical protein
MDNSNETTGNRTRDLPAFGSTNCATACPDKLIAPLISNSTCILIAGALRNLRLNQGCTNAAWQVVQQLNFARWRLIFVGSEHGTCFICRLWHLEFLSDPYILKHLWNLRLTFRNHASYT